MEGVNAFRAKTSKIFVANPCWLVPLKRQKNSQLFEQIIVSTDDSAIADIAQQHGATVSQRPAALADDYATTAAVIRHTLQHVPKASHICCLYPCTPLLKPQDLTDSFERWQSSNSLYCFPVLEFESNVLRSLKLSDTGEVSSMFSQHELTRTQDLPQAYFDAGQFYWGSREAWLSEDKIHNHALGYVLPKYSVVDIDDENDWRFAERLYQAQLALA